MPKVEVVVLALDYGEDTVVACLSQVQPSEEVASFGDVREKLVEFLSAVLLGTDAGSNQALG